MTDTKKNMSVCKRIEDTKGLNSSHKKEERERRERERKKRKREKEERKEPKKQEVMFTETKAKEEGIRWGPELKEDKRILEDQKDQWNTREVFCCIFLGLRFFSSEQGLSKKREGHCSDSLVTNMDSYSNILFSSYYILSLVLDLNLKCLIFCQE